MKIGVPGEFHEDRWQRTAEDLREACAPAHTGSERAVGYKLSRGEVGFWPVFGTATMPTSTSGASSRSEDGLLSPLVHEMSLSHGRRGPDRSSSMK